jgi:hypothetical protein
MRSRNLARLLSRRAPAVVADLERIERLHCRVEKLALLVSRVPRHFC